MPRQDLALLDNDLLIINGDIAIQESDIQHIDDTINSKIKQYLRIKTLNEL
ncbi:MAG: hypothetical protein M3Z26_00590 [Bacteroidota bacterium]|nr:hypothetical protein [Bacteroidota bacterium]